MRLNSDIKSSEHSVTPLRNDAELFRDPAFACQFSESIEKVHVKSGFIHVAAQPLMSE